MGTGVQECSDVIVVKIVPVYLGGEGNDPQNWKPFETPPVLESLVKYCGNGNK